MNSKVYIILLNYKNWQDTLECLLSIENLAYKNFEVVLVDNFSQNNSIQNIQQSLAKQKLSFTIHFIELVENGGFAKGNNAGLKFAQEIGDGDFFWVLNNDTTLDELALDQLVGAVILDRKAERKVGLYGSKLRYYSHPELLQAMGGQYNKWLGSMKEVGNLEIDKGQYDTNTTPNVLIGAAIFVTIDFLKEVGYFNEIYFIYFEEIDWAERGRKLGWGLKVVPSSVVYHKQGMATQASGLQNDQKSKLSDFYYFRNRLRITAQYFPYCLLTVYLSYLFTAINRIRRGQWDRLEMLWKVMWKFKTINWSDV